MTILNNPGGGGGGVPVSVIVSTPVAGEKKVISIVYNPASKEIIIKTED